MLNFSPILLGFCRLLESQLQSQKKTHDNELEALRGEIQSLKEENNRQQQLLAQNLQLPPEARIEASLQHEITRLTNENLVREMLLQCNDFRTLGRGITSAHILPSFQMRISQGCLHVCSSFFQAKQLIE